MNLDSDYASLYEDSIPAVSCNPRRRMRVRHSYPESLIELVGHLRSRMPAREIATALDIPLSSVYRWAPIWAETSTSIDVTTARRTDWNTLITRCMADGFHVPASIATTLASCAPKPLRQNGAHIPTLLKATVHSLSQNDPQKPGLGKSRLDAARSMIERDYFRDIDSNALAAVAGLSRFRFIHAFTAAYNISPHQYLLRVRIEAAKRLLATSRETIDVIAAATGFRSGACLNRAFTRVEGTCVSRFCRVVAARY